MTYAVDRVGRHGLRGEMRVLGIDTSTRSLSAAVLDGGKITAEFNGDSRLRHLQDLMPVIDSLLSRSKIDLAALDGFAVSVGPGSFTGLRIGVSAVKGLNLVTGKPIAAVPTLDVLASNIKKGSGAICVIVDAKKNKLYAAIYAVKDGKLEKKSSYLLITLEELLKKINPQTTFTGDGVKIYKEKILSRLPDARFANEKLWIPRASAAAVLGAEMLKANITTSGDELVPMYLYSRECGIRGVEK